MYVTFFFYGTASTAEQKEFGKFFRDATLRVDYYHTGTKGEERFSVDRMYEEGTWPGSVKNLVDTMNLGEFLLKITDAATNQLIYSRGYSTMFGEWQTTDEAAAGVQKTFQESARIPFPLRRFQFSIARRTKRMAFEELFTLTIDPASIDIRRNARRVSAPVSDVMVNGDSHEKVDLVILGDGYTADEMEKFHRDVKHFTDVLFGTSPFKEKKKCFNVRSVDVVSPQSGIDQPDVHQYKGNALGTTYNTFGSARYVLTEDNRLLRDYASLVPYDYLYIIVNAKRYGGGGIFRLYSTCYTIGETPETAWQADYVFVHEFGHSFAGLGDEYYSSSVAYNEFYPKGVEPWEPNVTATINRGELKWRQFVDTTTPLPTPWSKARYDSIETERGKLQRDTPGYAEKRQRLIEEGQRVLHEQRLQGVVGAFEGSGYSSTGLYRPAVDCRMFSLSLVDFDPVCRHAIESMIDYYSR
jgi:hypothetical protein